MPKNSVQEWDTTASNNTDVGGIGIQGTNAVSNFDNGLRTVMSQIATYVRPLQQTATTIAALKAIDTTKFTFAFLTVAGKEGVFKWVDGEDGTDLVDADPEEGVYLESDFVPVTDGYWKRLYVGPLLITWFGAYPGNTAGANDTAINAAFALAVSQTNTQRRAVHAPAGDYAISGTNLIERQGLQFAFSGDGEFATVFHRTGSSTDPLFHVKAEGVSFRDMSIQQSTFVSGDGSVGILAKKDYGTIDPDTGVMPTADSDFSMSRVRVTGFDVGVDHWGRGFNTEDCSMSGNGWGSEWSWPDLVDYTEGSQLVQKDATGFRYFQHSNIRGHSNTSGLFRNEGANAHKINGIEINGVSMDIGRRLFKGVLRQAIVTGFAVTQTPTPAFTLTDGSENYEISGGTIQGDTAASRVPAYFVELTGDHSSGVIKFLGQNCTSHGVYHDGSGVATEMAVDCHLVEAGTGGGGANGVRFDGANHTGTIAVTLDVAVALAGVVRGTSSSNAMKVTKATSLRTFTPPLDPLSLGIRMDNDFFTSAPTAGNFANYKNHDNTLRGSIKAAGSSSMAIWLNEGLDLSIQPGSGSPEGVVTAGRGALYIDLGAGANLYIKSTTSGNTGWKLFTRAA